MKSVKRKYSDTDAPVLESLESRVLFSADIPGLISPSDLHSDDNLAPFADSFSDNNTLDLDIVSTAPQPRLELVFVSQVIPEHQQISQELQRSSHDNTDVLVYQLSPDEGLDHVSAIVSGHQNIDAVHFLSHGEPDQLRVGADVVESGQLSALAQWSDSLTETADLAFYGCNLAATESGRELLHDIARVTGAGVAASIDATGPTLLGGDWQLEFDTELIESTVLLEGLDTSRTLLQSVTVDEVADEVDAPDLSSVDALLADKGVDGKVSLREAILAANANSDHDTIYLDSQTYRFNDGPDDYTGDFDIRNPLTIIGNGPDNTEIDGDHKDRLLELSEAVEVTIIGVELKEGSVPDGGGGIYSNGTDLTLDNVKINNTDAASGGGLFLNSGGFTHLKNVLFQNNSSTSVGGALFINENADNHVLIEDSVFKNAEAKDGGTFQSAGAIWNGGLIQMYRTQMDGNNGANGAGIFNRGEAYVAESHFVDQTSSADGGAIYNEGTITVERSLLKANSATSGGAISNSGTLTVNDSTLSGNNGSAIHHHTGDATINRSTLADNTGALYSAIAIDSGIVSMQGTLLERNDDPANDNIGVFGSGSYTSLGHNLSDRGLPNPHSDDIQNTAAGLGTDLVDVGSYTATYVFDQGSPAYNAGPVVNSDPQAPTIVDVTGLRRGPASDIGAYELRSIGYYSGPSVTDNQLLNVASGSNTTITTDRLYATDPNLPSAATNTIVFSVKDTDLAHGTLLLDGSALSAASDTFTLDDLINRRVSYQHDGTGSSDEFAFTVSDGSDTSAEATFAIHIESSNNAPAMTSAAAVSADENTTTPLFPALTINDADDTHLEYAAIVFDSGYNATEDALVFNNGPVVTGNWNGATGQLEFTGTDTVANYQAALRSVQFQHSSASPDTTQRILSVSADDGNQRTTNTATLTVTSINNAPVISNVETTAIFYTENDPATSASNTLQLQDEDSTQLQSAVVRLTSPGYDAATEFLDASAFGSIVVSWDAPTGELRFTGPDTLATYVSTLRSVEYTNTSDAPSTDPRTIQFRVTDDTGMSSTAERTLTIASVNDPPLGNDLTVETLEDQPLTLKADDFAFSDPAENHGLESIVITSVPGGNTLEFSGVPVTLNQVIVKSDIDAEKLTFTPPQDTHGSGFTTLGFTVTDDGGTANGGVNTAVANSTLTFDIRSVNDPPTGSDATIEVTEDEPYAFSRVDFGFQDLRDGDNFNGLAITALPSRGSITLAGTELPGTSPPVSILVTTADLDAGSLIYTPPANDHGTALTTLQFQVIDDGPTVGASDNNTDPIARTLTIDVEPVNDPPVGSSTTINAFEDQAYEFSSADFGFTDPLDGHSFSEVLFTTLPDKGELTLYGAPVNTTFSVSVSDIEGAPLLYTPPANQYGTAFTTLQFKVIDDGPTAAATDNNTDTTARSLTINVAAINDAPLAGDTTVIATEDQDLILSAADFGYSDLSDNHNLQSIEIVTPPVGNTLTLNGSAVAANQVIDGTDIDAGKLVFSPPPNAYGTNHSVLTFKVTDDGGTDQGGLNTSLSVGSLRFDITPVNDPPVGTSGSVSTNENQTYVFDRTDFGYTDPHDGDQFHSLIVTQLPDKGTLTLGGTVVITTSPISVADIDTGQLIYTPPVDENGLALTRLDFLVIDNGTNSGADDNNIDTTARSLWINVGAVNNPPLGSDLTAGTLEDEAVTLSINDFGFSDPADNNNLQSVNVVIPPGGNTLALNNIPVTAGQRVPASEIVAGNLVFTPPANVHGSNHDSLVFTVTDDGGTSNGGQDTAVSGNTLTFDITPVNDAPAGSNGAVTAFEDLPYVFGSTDFGFSDANDSDAFAAVLFTTLPHQGALTVAGNPADTAVPVSVTDIDAGLLSFAPPADDYGAALDVIQFRVIDDGPAGGTSGTNIDNIARTLNIDVGAVNDPPDAASLTIATMEDENLVLQVTDFGFTDPADNHGLLSVNIVTSPAGDTLTVDGVPVNNGQLVSAADIDAGKLVFTPPPNAHGSDYTSLVFNLTDDGGTDNGGEDTSTLNRTLTFDINPVNDPPTGTSSSISTLEDHTYVFAGTDFGFSDTTDGHQLAGIIFQQLPDEGTLSVSDTPVTALDFVSATDINSGRLTYTPPADSSANALTTLQFTVVDDGPATTAADRNADTVVRTLTVDVTAVNDPPTAENRIVTTLEDWPLTIKVSDLGFKDALDAHGFKSMQLISVPAGNTLLLNGIPVTENQIINAAEINNGEFVFEPPTDANGQAYAELEFRVSDDGGTDHGGDNRSVSSNRLTFDITPINDPPTGADITIHATEDEAYRFSRSDFGFTDLSDGDLFDSVLITQLPDKGLLTLAGAPVASSAVSAADIDAGHLVYTPPPNVSSHALTTMQFRVLDDGLTGLHDINIDSVARILTVDVAPTDDKPTGAHSTAETLEDHVYQFSSGDFTFSDPDPGAYLSAIQITALPDQGLLTLNNATINSGSMVTNVDIESGLLRYQPANDINGREVAALGYRLIDNSGLASDDSYQLLIDIQSVSDAPVLGNSAVELSENTTHRFSLADFAFSDLPERDSLQTLVIETTPDRGTLQLRGNVVAVGTTVTVEELTAGLLSYQAVPDTYDQRYSSFQFHVTDSGSTDHDGTNVSNSATLQIDVTRSRSIPTALELVVATREDQTLTITNDYLGLGAFTENGAVAGIRLESSNVNGRLTNADEPIKVDSLVTLGDIERGKLVYRPPLNISGPALDSLSFTIVERNGSHLVQPKVDQMPSLLTIDVLPVNDPPVAISLPSTTITEHSDTRTISDISVTDIDVDDTFTLSVDDERLHIINGNLQLKPGIEIDFEQEQTIPVTITATDSGGAALKQSFTLQVQNINEAPVATTDRIDQYASSATDASLVIKINTNHLVDPDGDELTFSLVQTDGSSLPAGVTFDRELRALVVDTAKTGFEPIRVKVIAEDPFGKKAELPLNLYFEPQVAAAFVESDTNSTPVTEADVTATVTATTTTSNEVTGKTVQSARAAELRDLLDFYEQLSTGTATADQAQSATSELPEVVKTPFNAAIVTTTTAAERISTGENTEQASELPVAAAATDAQQTDDQLDQLLFELAKSLNDSKSQVAAPARTETVIEVSSVALSSGLSVGYIVWLLRGGAIVASMMSSMPAWRFIDPLPVLEGDGDEDQPDAESLESMVNKDRTNDTPAPRAVTPQD